MTITIGLPGEPADRAVRAGPRPAERPPLREAGLMIRLIVTLGVGVGAGLSGMSVALLLHLIQHFAYGYSLNAVISSETFLMGVTASAPAHRILVLAGCGAVAGTGWWLVYLFGRPLVSISKAVKAEDPQMPILTTTAHALLQIITVALGSPLGREVAPREIAATLAAWQSRRAGLSVRQTQIMVACGAGAGLAAVYNVPLGGAIFVMEVLTGTFSASIAVPALATSVIASTVAWIGLGDRAQYTVQPSPLSASLVTWSIVSGPLFGAAAYGFSRLTSGARAGAPRDWRIIPFCIFVFTAIGVAAAPYPALLGNGKGPIQMGFDNALGIKLAAALLILKLTATSAALRAGAEGGLLTPGMTIGALCGILLGWLWTRLVPGTPVGAFAVVGAAAFLASSMRMPITAIVLALEFTRVDQDVLVPILFAVAGSTAALRLCMRRFDKVDPKTTTPRGRTLATAPMDCPDSQNPHGAGL